MNDRKLRTFKGNPIALLTAAQRTEYVSECKLRVPLFIDPDTALLMDKLTTLLTDAPDMLSAYILILQGIESKDIKPIRQFGTTGEMLSFKHSGVGGRYSYHMPEGPTPSMDLQEAIEAAHKKFDANERHGAHAPDVVIPLYSKDAHDTFLANASDMLSQFEETEETAIVIVDVTTFEMVTDIRAAADQHNGIIGLDFITECTADPMLFPNNDLIVNLADVAGGIEAQLQAMELSRDGVTRSMELKYLQLKALQYQEAVLQNQIRLLKGELDQDEKYINSHYDVDHHKTVDDSLLNLKGI
jgi:hypothetical protein